MARLPVHLPRPRGWLGAVPPALRELSRHADRGAHAFGAAHDGTFPAGTTTITTTFDDGTTHVDTVPTRLP